MKKPRAKPKRLTTDEKKNSWYKTIYIIYALSRTTYTHFHLIPVLITLLLICLAV